MAKVSDLKWNYRIFMQTYRYRQYDCGLPAGRTIGGPDKSGTEGITAYGSYPANSFRVCCACVHLAILKYLTHWAFRKINNLRRMNRGRRFEPLSLRHLSHLFRVS